MDTQWIRWSLSSFAVGVCLWAMPWQMPLAQAADPLKKLVFVYVRPRENEMAQWLMKIYTTALERMGHRFELFDAPPKRASALSNNGIVDGELGRVYSYNEKYTNMVRVAEHHLKFQFVAIGSDPSISLTGWESLQPETYRVAYRKGIVKCEVQLPRVVPPDRLIVVATVDQGVKMVSAGRVDLYVDVEGMISKYRETEKFQAFNQRRPIRVVGVMETTTGHAFLHRKHHALTGQLAGILRDMKREGLFETYRKQVGITQSLTY